MKTLENSGDQFNVRETSPSGGNMQSLRSFIKTRIDLIATTAEGFRSLRISVRYC